MRGRIGHHIRGREFDETVNVAGGIPTLTLDDGGVAHYVSGSGTGTLTYQYTVATGDNTADLAVTGPALNGATIRTRPATNADLAGTAVNPTGATDRYDGATRDRCRGHAFGRP